MTVVIGTTGYEGLHRWTWWQQVLAGPAGSGEPYRLLAGTVGLALVLLLGS